MDKRVAVTSFSHLKKEKINSNNKKMRRYLINLDKYLSSLV
jgi:hypothetical protein